MKNIVVSLPESLEYVNVHIFADEHIGDAQSSIERLKERIEIVKNDEHAYCILNGDLIDYTSKTSIGDIEAREFNIMGQLEQFVALFEPIKDKILAITKGNHENRAYNREGIDLCKLVAAQLGVLDRYSSGAAYLWVSVGKATHQATSKKRKALSQYLYTIYMVHGTGNGRKEGAKAIRLADMASICDADIYIHAHTHLPMVFKESYIRPVHGHKTLEQTDRLFVNAAANMTYGGYGEAMEFKPMSNQSPVIRLSGRTKKEFNATL